MLQPLIPIEHTTKDSFTFVKDIKEVSFNNKFLVSFDVNSLFTNIPLNETIDIAVDLIFKNRNNLCISRHELKQLFLFATAQTHFIFKNNVYDQIDGVAMGSPLAPVLANLFMGHHEKIWLSDYSGPSPTIYKRYVDDIFAMFQNESDAENFFDYLNSRHINIKFSMEKEVEKKLPFLDVHIR